MNTGDVDVIAPNFKRRLSGVTTTIVQLVPEQARHIGIAVLGPGLPPSLPRLRFRQLAALWRPPASHKVRVWHARRNIEMLAGIALRDILRMPLRLAFTSASQRVHQPYTRWLIGRMDAVIATSARTGSYLKVPHDVVMHGIDTRRFRPADDPAEERRRLGLPRGQRLAGCFGRVRHQKGTDLFVDAMIALLPERPGWSAMVAGRATTAHAAFASDLRRRVDAAGLSERILFVGEHENIAEWYRALDLFVAPQRWEGFGMTPLEAMATGVPVVAADVGAFSELIQTGASETGILVPADRLDALSAAVAALMDDTGRAGRLGQNGIAHVRQRFDISSEASQLAKIYNRLLTT